MAWNPYLDMVARRLQRMKANGATVAELAKAKRELMEENAKHVAAKKARRAA